MPRSPILWLLSLVLVVSTGLGVTPTDLAAQCYDCEFDEAENEHKLCEFGADTGYFPEPNGIHCNTWVSASCVWYHKACVGGESSDAQDAEEIQALLPLVKDMTGQELRGMIAEYPTVFEYSPEWGVLLIKSCVEGEIAAALLLTGDQITGLTAAAITSAESVETERVATSPSRSSR